MYASVLYYKTLPHHLFLQYNDQNNHRPNMHENEEEGNYAWLNKGDWSTPENLKFVKNIKQWDLTELFADENNRPLILKDIDHIKFISLFFLSIRNNHIQSIESLAHLNMPHIQHLYLQRNDIICARILRKTHWPSIQFLWLMNNPICDAQTLNYAHLPLKQLRLFANGQKKSHINQYFVFKLETKLLAEIWIAPHQLRFESSKQKFIQRRWNNIRIY